MEHLRAMDHLRSSVGLRGYAQVDPKVEYKREGMKIFEEMWSGVSDKVTDLIFRMEQFDPEFLHYLGSRWQLDRARTIHEAASSEPRPSPGATSGPSRRPRSPRARDRARRKPEPVRNTGRRSAGTTLAPADRVKNSKPAACGRKDCRSLLSRIGAGPAFAPRPPHGPRQLCVDRRSPRRGSTKGR